MGSIKGQKHNPYIEGRYAHINPNDVVFTPDWLAKQICGMFDIAGKVSEPCKGEGAFLKYLPTDTDWCEIADGKNYYDYNEKVDWIVTNPPYSDYNRFLEHSFALADNIVLLVPVAKMFKSMGTLKAINGILFTSGEYWKMQIPTDSIIYCDPPYENTSGYKTGNFNHSLFWDWCRNMRKLGHTIFVSEYNAPEDFECVWSKQVASVLDKKGTNKKPIERLFTPKC